MSLLCKIFGHSYSSIDTTAESKYLCLHCNHVKSIFPEIKEYPPMPQVKAARVTVEEVQISGAAIALAHLENEKETLNRLILDTMRRIDQEKSRLNDLLSRRDFTAKAMHALIEQN